MDKIAVTILFERIEGIVFIEQCGNNSNPIALFNHFGIIFKVSCSLSRILSITIAISFNWFSTHFRLSTKGHNILHTIWLENESLIETYADYLTKMEPSADVAILSSALLCYCSKNNALISKYKVRKDFISKLLTYTSNPLWMIYLVHRLDSWNYSSK